MKAQYLQKEINRLEERLNEEYDECNVKIKIGKLTDKIIIKTPEWSETIYINIEKIGIKNLEAIIKVKLEKFRRKKDAP